MVYDEELLQYFLLICQNKVYYIIQFFFLKVMLEVFIIWMTFVKAVLIFKMKLFVLALIKK